MLLGKPPLWASLISNAVKPALQQPMTAKTHILMPETAVERFGGMHEAADAIKQEF